MRERGRGKECRQLIRYYQCVCLVFLCLCDASQGCNGQLATRVGTRHKNRQTLKIVREGEGEIQVALDESGQRENSIFSHGEILSAPHTKTQRSYANGWVWRRLSPRNAQSLSRTLSRHQFLGKLKPSNHTNECSLSQTHRTVVGVQLAQPKWCRLSRRELLAAVSWSSELR